MTVGGKKNASKTVSIKAPGKAKPRKAKPDRARGAKSTSSGKAGASRKPRAPRKSAGKATSDRGRASSAASAGKPPRLSAGGLDPLVLDYLRKNKATAPHTPGQVAKALGRSYGAVGNCLARLTEAKKAKRVGAKPQQFDLAG